MKAYIQRLRGTDVLALCVPSLQKLYHHPLNRDIFNQPVDPIALNIPDYLTIIKHPMDLQTVRSKLKRGVYATVDEYAADVRLVFSNAMEYNPPPHMVYSLAEQLLEIFETSFDKICSRAKALQVKTLSHACQFCSGIACSLCQQKCLPLEAQALICTNTCRRRISRGSYFFVNDIYRNPAAARTGAIAKNITCTKCFYKKQSGPQVGDMSRRRHEGLSYESWQKCVSCDRRFHTLCAQYNCRRGEEFRCHICLLAEEQRSTPDPKPISDRQLASTAGPSTSRTSSSSSNGFQAPSLAAPSPSPCPRPASKAATDSTHSATPLANHDAPDARRLPAIPLATYLQQRIARRVREEWEKQERVDASEEEVEDALRLTVRVVSLAPQTVKVDLPEQLGTRDMYPEQVQYEQVALFLFQKMEGMDVMLFGAYMNEFGANAGPNSRSIYLNYVDSVNYMQPRWLRTPVYHELLQGKPTDTPSIRYDTREM